MDNIQDNIQDNNQDIWGAVSADTTAEGQDDWAAGGDGADGEMTDFFAMALDGEDTTEPDGGTANGKPDTTGEQYTNTADGKPGRAEDTTKAAGEPKDTTKGENGRAAGNNAGEEAEKQVYTLKICGEEKRMSLPELMALAQKGGDYDRIRGNYDDIKGEAHRLRELAAASGKSAGELLDELAGAGRRTKVTKMAEELAGGGVDEKLAGVLAELLVDRETAGAAVGADEAAGADGAGEEAAGGGAKSAADGSDEDADAVARSIRRLVDEYGVEKLPDEVIRMSVDKGMLPFEAYQAWKIAEGEKQVAELRDKLAAEETNRANGNRTPGSLSGGANEQRDPFLAGFEAM